MTADNEAIEASIMAEEPFDWSETLSEAMMDIIVDKAHRQSHERALCDAQVCITSLS